MEVDNVDDWTDHSGTERVEVESLELMPNTRIVPQKRAAPFGFLLDALQKRL